MADTIAEKLLQVNQSKQDIKNAIETKGVPMIDIPFVDYADQILEINQQVPRGFTTGTNSEYNVNIPNAELRDGLVIAVSFNEANSATPYLSLNNGDLIKINTLYGTALAPLLLPNRYYILTYHLVTNVWTIQIYNEMTETDLTNKTTEPKVISGELLGDKLDEVETNKQNKLVAGDNITINTVTNVISAIDNSYKPDEVTIVVNSEDKLKVSKDLKIDGGFL